MITDYPGRFSIPVVRASMGQISRAVLESVILCNPEHPDYIDVFIQKWRREVKKPRKWWQKLFRRRAHWG